jgi:ParB family chromosome partitioning protein
MPAPTTPKPRAAGDAARHVQDELFELPLDRILPGPNVRSPGALDVVELAASIKANGVLQPIRVRAAVQPDGGGTLYELVIGHRRLAAAKLAGLSHIPAVVASGPAAKLSELTIAQLVENLQRADLNPLEEAKAYRALLDTGLSQRQLGAQLGRAPSTIAHALRLLKVPAAVQEQIASGALTASHAKAIASLPADEQAELGRRVVEHQLSAHQVEDEVALAQRRAAEADRRDEDRKNREATRLATVIDLLARKKVDPQSVTLVGFSGTAGDVLKQLEPLGWRVKTDASYATPAKGICDCAALRLQFRYEWSGGKEVEKASLAKACISSKHQAAASKAEREAWDAEQAERRDAELKAQAERDAELEPIAAAVATAIPPAKARLLLFALVDAGDDGYWQAGELAERIGAKLTYGGWREELWAAIDALEHGRLLSEIAHRVAEVVQGAGRKHPMRAVVAELASAADQKGGAK